MRLLFPRTAAVAFAFVSLLFTVAPANAASTPFATATPKVRAAQAPGTLAISLNAEALRDLPPGSEVSLPLPGGGEARYFLEQSIPHGGGFTTWIGRGAVRGTDDRVVVTQGPAGSFGWANTSAGAFKIRPSGAGHDLISPMQRPHPGRRGGGDDAMKAPPDREHVAALKGVATHITRPQSKLGTTKVMLGPTVRADVMFIYTKDLAEKMGTGLLPLLYNVIASANLAYQDSEIAIELRLVNATMLDHPNSVSSNDTLSGMGGGGAYAAVFEPLTWGAASLRNQVGADFVALLRDGPEDTGGVGYLLANPAIYPAVAPVDTAAYSVNNFCTNDCANIVTHEIGHNMGSHHDISTIATDNNGAVTVQGVFPYSYGHYSCAGGLDCNPYIPGGCAGGYPACVGNDANDFGTIMAYVRPTVMKFSNPDVECKPGRPCGGASVAPAPAKVADNGRSMNEVRGSISAYRNETIVNHPGSVQFTQAGYTAAEGAGTLNLTVSRSSGSAGAISVGYTITGLNATAGIDFTGTTGTLTWADGDTANKTIAIPLVGDLAPEGLESLRVTLGAPTGPTGVYTGYPSVATGVILENWPAGTLGGLPTTPAGWSTPGGGGAPWAISNDSAPAGDPDGVSLKSGALNFAALNCPNDPEYQGSYGNVPCPSIVQYAGNTSAGTVSFAYRVNGYPRYGFLEFRLDGVLLMQASGDDVDQDSGWQVFSAPITAGPHTLEWRYRTRLNFACPAGCSDRAWIDQLVLPLPVTTSLTMLGSSLNPSNIGQSVTFTATVSGAGLTPTGTVFFRADGTAIAGCAPSTITGGVATCTTAGLAAGSRNITATYSGSTTYANSVSSVLAQAVIGPHVLTVNKAGAGTGTVTSSPAGVNCSATCAPTLAQGTYTLTATPNAGSVFSGWSGACTGTGTCVVNLTAATSVTATFAVVGVAQVTMNPTSLAFGNQSMGTSSVPRTVTVSNTGGAALTITSIVSSNPQFAATHDCPGSLAIGASCTVTLVATAGAALGPLNALVPVSANLTANTSAGAGVTTLSMTAERSLVRHYYRAILNRDPDGAGQAYWEGEAARLAGLGVSVNEAYFVMAGYFFNSAEYLALGKSDVAFVADLYNTFFNRAADAGGSNYWTGQIAGGLPREVVLFSFMFSNEFRTFTQAIFGSTPVRPEVDMVVDLFRGILNRLPDTASYNYWLGRIRAAQCAGAGPVYTEIDAMSAAFIFNPEYNNRARNNTQFVTDMYYSFLRRGGDIGGVQYWINELNTAARDINNVRINFINNPEFGTRVTNVINAGCAP